MSYTELVDTAYGRMLIPRNDAPRGHLLRTTGRADDDEMIWALCDILQQRGPNAVAVDAGANVGCFTLAFASTGARVVAFEPQCLIYNMLCGSVALNGLTRTACHKVVLAATTGSVPVPVYDYDIAGDFGCAEIFPTTGPQVGQPPHHYEKVRCAPLDSYCSRRLDVLKIDVEGMEESVLDGAVATVQEHRPVILVEWHKSSRIALQDRLQSWGYAVTERGRDLLATPL